jgi:hypothetical protein
MWQVIYIATKEEAQLIKEKLTIQGFLVKVEPMDDENFQIKVPESEAEEVYQLLTEFFQN